MQSATWYFFANRHKFNAYLIKKVAFNPFSFYIQKSDQSHEPHCRE